MNRASRNRHNSSADGEVCSIRVMTLKTMLATVGIVRVKAHRTNWIAQDGTCLAIRRTRQVGLVGR